MALDTKTQDKLPGLSAIIHPESNHRAYYDAIKAASTISERDTCIPWLPIHLKELDKVVRQPVTIQVDGQHLVNFKRYTTFMDRVRDILHYSPPDLEDKRYGGQLTYLSNELRDIDLSGDLEQELLTRSRALSIQESSSKSNRRVNLHNLGFEIS
jgi:son of sevenless-like protein